MLPTGTISTISKNKATMLTEIISDDKYNSEY